MQYAKLSPAGQIDSQIVPASPRASAGAPTLPPELVYKIYALAYPTSDVGETQTRDRMNFGLVCRSWYFAERALPSAIYIGGLRRTQLVADELQRRREAGRSTTVSSIIFRAREDGDTIAAAGEAGARLAAVLAECPAITSLVLALRGDGKLLGVVDEYGSRLVEACRRSKYLTSLSILDPPDDFHRTESLTRFLLVIPQLQRLKLSHSVEPFSIYPAPPQAIPDLPLRLHSLTMKVQNLGSLEFLDALVRGSSSTLRSIIIPHFDVVEPVSHLILIVLKPVAPKLKILVLPTSCGIDSTPPDLLTFLARLVSVRHLIISPAWIGTKGESIFDVLSTLPKLQILNIEWRRDVHHPHRCWDYSELCAFIERKSSLRRLYVRVGDDMPTIGALMLEEAAHFGRVRLSFMGTSIIEIM